MLGFLEFNEDNKLDENIDKAFSDWKSKVKEANPEHAEKIKFVSKADQKHHISAEHGDRSFGTFNMKSGKGEMLGESKMPIPNHPYHKKTNAELEYIVKDAGKAAKAQKGMDSESKYLDQMNDASTVLNYRRKSVKEETEEINEDLQAEEIQTKVQKYLGGPRGKDYEVKIDFTTKDGERGTHTHVIKNAISPKHAKRIAMNKHDDMFKDKHKSFGTSSQGVKEINEESVVIEELSMLEEGIGVHGKYTIKTGPTVRGVSEGPPEHVKALKNRLNAIGAKSKALGSGEYGQTHRAVVKNTETGETTHHHIYQSDVHRSGKPIMSVRNVGEPRRNQAEHAQVLKDYLSGKKVMKEEIEQIDELSKDTLSKYIKQSSMNLGFQGMAAGSSGVGSKDNKNAVKAMGKRHAGIIKAATKLAKEEIEQIQENYVVHVDDGSKYDEQPHPKDTEHVMAGVKKHTGEFDGRSDKGAYFKFKSSSDAKRFVDHVKRAPHKSVFADLHESIELEENFTVAPAPYIHRIGVTVSDPTGTAVSKRNETIQKFVNVHHHTDNKDEALERGKKHFAKKGWKVHDAWHAGVMEDTEQIDEISKETLKSYIPKAMGSKSAADFTRGVKMAQGSGGEEELRKKSEKRSEGIHRAIKKLTQEQAELEEASSLEKSHIEQSLADRDINSKVEGKKVQVHKDNVKATKAALKKMGYHEHEVHSGLNEDRMQEYLKAIADHKSLI